MIICICNNISEREIRQVVDLGVTSMSELRDGLGAATCCGKCRDCATQFLRECLSSKADGCNSLQRLPSTLIGA